MFAVNVRMFESSVMITSTVVDVFSIPRNELWDRMERKSAALVHLV
jgi:hypothetical protein